MPAKKAPATKKAPAKKKAAKKPPAAKAPAGSSAGFDGDRLVSLLGADITDPRLVAIIRELGFTKPIADDIELKKLGIALSFENDKLRQVRFEIRRKWTGHARYEGRLPFGMSADTLTKDQATVLAAHGTGRVTSDSWYRYDFPSYEISMGFGKTYVETVFAAVK